MNNGPHEALKLIAAGERAAGLEALVTAMGRFDRDAPGSDIDALCHLLDVYPALRAALRTTLRELLGDATAAGLLSETGILANTGFFTEFGRRLLGRVLPAPRDLTLRGQFGSIFDGGDDAAWLANLSAADGIRVITALRLDEDDVSAWAPAWHAVFEALDVLSVRVAAMGVEPELLRHYRVPQRHDNPFLAQNAVLQAWLATVRDNDAGNTHGDMDIRPAEVLLAQCREVGERIRRHARHDGASLRLTFLLQRLDQSLRRMTMLLQLVNERGCDDDAAIARRMQLGIELALAERNAHDIGEHLHESTGLLALLATDNASRTGEHYITSTRHEYFAMFRAALGAGGIIGLMAIVKMLLASLHLPPLIEALVFSLNYAIGFVLIYVLRFTVATKQPAMTAQTIAAGLSSGTAKQPDADAISLLLSRVARSQFIAVMGNVMLAAPVALVATVALVAVGSQVPMHKAPLLLADLHPFASLALVDAAIAGVWLFVAGLVSAYADNLATYERIGDRVRRIPWLGRVAGTGRREQFAGWIEAHFGGVAGNVFFGFALGMTGFIATSLGLPFDIRHVTFSAANLAIALVGIGFEVPLATVAIAALGVVLIALVNVAVSFTLALWLALRARGEHVDDIGRLRHALWQRFRAAPAAFLWPPRNAPPD